MININARQYSEAIYEIAKEEKVVDDYIQLSLALINISNDNQQVFNFLSSREITIEKKKELIKEITCDYEFYTNWLNILVESGRSKYIRQYIEELINIHNKAQGIIKGHAYTTTPLDENLLKELEESSSKKIGKKVMLVNKIDKEIIGGIKLVIEDDVWDNTIKNKLKQLLKEGNGK